jgi:hypothetical protein
MFFFTSIANQSGEYSLRLFVKHVAGVSLYNTSIPSFYVTMGEAEKPPKEDLQPPSGASFPPLIGFIGIWGILIVCGLVLIVKALELTKKIKIVS